MTKRKRFPLIALIFAVMLLAAAGWGWSVWVRVYNNPPSLSIKDDDPPVPEIPEKNILNILILGLDQLQNEPARADSIMVMSINQDTDEVAIISIPRDSRVEIPGYGMDKINHAMAYKDQVALMKRTVENLLGVPIHHYVYTNFTGFTKLVDILGGVTVNVKHRMVHKAVYGPPINLQAGVQTLNGTQALGYVRYRGDNNGDFGRMQRQQEFIKLVAEKALQPQSIFKLPQLLEQVARHVRTDMTIPQLLDFSRKAASIDLDEIITVSLQGRNINVKGVSYVELNQEFLAETIERYLMWEDAPEEPEQLEE